MAYGVMPSMITEEQAKSVFMDAMRWQLQRILKDTPRDGGDMQMHLYANEVFGVIHQIMANGVPLTKAGDALAMESQRRGWPQDTYDYAYHEFNRLVASPDVSEGQLDQYSRTFGIKRTTTNDDRMITEIRAARSRACFRVNEMLRDGQWTRDQWVEEAIARDGQPFAFEAPVAEANASAGNMQPAKPADGSGSEATVAGSHSVGGTGHLQSPAVDEMAAPGVPPAMGAQVPPAVPPVPVQPQPVADLAEANSADGNADWTIKELVEQVIADVYLAVGKREAAVQMGTFAKMLYHVMGGPDAPARSLQQTHVGALMTLMDQLPSRWGRKKEEKAGGIAASLKRAALQPAQEVGVSATTKAKHLTYFATLLEHGPDYVAIPQLNLAPSQKKIAAALEQQSEDYSRVPWTGDEIARLLNTPPFTGCAGAKRSDRYLPGTNMYHDSAYWMPLMLIQNGGRSSELGGLALDDIFEDALIPYIWIRVNKFRGLKNGASERKVPIPPELLRLGFRDFVAAVRQAAARNPNIKCLFPDLLPKTDKADFASNYMKGFEILRECAFPEGTSALRKIRGANKDKDVHCFRHTFVTELYYGGVNEAIIQSLIGHCTDLSDMIPELRQRTPNKNNTTRGYRGQPALEIVLPAFEKISKFTSHLAPFKIELNPLIYMEATM